MKLVRPVLVTATAAALFTGVVASASPATSPTTLVLTDTNGDANALNDEGFGSPAPQGTATPGSQAAMDIVKATFADTGTTKKVRGKKVFTCTGFTVTIEMAGPVNTSIPAIYRVIGNTTANDGVFQLYWNNAPTGAATEVRYGAGSADDTVALSNEAKIDGNKIVLTITTSDIKGFGDKLGDEIVDFAVQDSISSGATFAPQVDQLISDKTFKMC